MTDNDMIEFANFREVIRLYKQIIRLENSNRKD